MTIEANKAMLLIRYNNYKKTDFIEEHNKVIASNGYVWMLKTGKTIVEAKLKKVLEETDILLLRAPKKDGGKYYITNIEEYRYGDSEAGMKFPKYYKNLVEDEALWEIDSLSGTWLKIGPIREMPKEVVSKFQLISNNKNIEDVINSTRSATLYVISIKNVEL